MNLHRCILGNNDCFKAGQLVVPQGVMIHSTGANNPMLRRYVQPMVGCSDYNWLMELLGDNPNNNDWNQPRPGGNKVCVHGFIGKLADGSVASVQTLPWDIVGWHSGYANARSTTNANKLGYISFEICEDDLKDPAYFSEVYREAVELTAYLCRMYGFDPLGKNKYGYPYITCHREGYDYGIAYCHADVLHWFPKFGKSMDDFRQDVKKELEDEDMDVARFTELWREMRKGLQDNDSAEWSREAREWAVNNGLVQGGSADGFNGMWEDLLTREQMVVLMFRFAQKVGLV